MNLIFLSKQLIFRKINF